MAAIFNSDSNLDSIWLKIIHSHSPWWWQPSWILSYWTHPFCTKKTSKSFLLSQLDDASHLEFSAILDSTILPKTLTQTNSLWLKVIYSHPDLMMAAILNSFILHSTILHKTLTQTISIWLKLIHSLLTWWWQPSWTLPSCNSSHFEFSHLSFFSETHSHLPRLVPTICTQKLHSFILTQFDDGSHLQFCHLGFNHLSLFLLCSLTLAKNGSHHLHKKKLHSLFPLHHLHKILHSFNRINLMMAAILNLAILDSAILHTKNFTHLFWFNLMMAAVLNSDHVEFRHCHLWFRHLVIFSEIHSKTLSLHSDSESKYFNMTQTHSFSCNLMMAAISNSAILDSTNLHKTVTSNLFILTQSHWWWQLILMMPAIFNSTILHSAILPKTLTQTNSIWLKVIHSDSTWWWQTSWILPCSIPPSCIQHS